MPSYDKMGSRSWLTLAAAKTAIRDGEATLRSRTLDMSGVRASTTLLLPPTNSIPPSIRDKAKNDAKDYQRVIEGSLKGSNSPEFEYTLLELIGKGSYGRVYRAKHNTSGREVAIKIINIEALDLNARSKPLGLDDSQKEIDILARLRDFPTINVNNFIEAFSAHEHLCIVSEYCSGGSLTTLRRATQGNRLDERYIRPIARELAFALKSVHAAGIVHRDVKCSNVMVDENGRIQLIDFGVAGIVMTTMPQDKRKTVIGTPHWMPPELQWDKPEISHGTEVDVWAYGITLYECATGAPPNAGVINPRQLRQIIRKNPVRLTDESFTPELRDLIAFVLEPDAEKRPTMEQVCQHEYLSGVEDEFPTEVLHELVQQYIKWENSGGVRHSLWMAGGAEKVETVPEILDQDDGWNFSATDAFRKRMSQIDPSFNYALNPFIPAAIPEEPTLSNSPPPEDEYFEGQLTAKHGAKDDPPSTFSSDYQSTYQHAQGIGNAERGENQLMNLFNPNAPAYEYNYGQSSDLPLRQGGTGSLHRQELSVSSSNGKVPAINLEDVSNKKRATMAWTWNEGLSQGGTSENGGGDDDFFADLPTSRQATSRQSDFFGDLAPPPQPGLDRAATMPVGAELQDHRATLDLDALLGPASSYALPQSGPSSFAVNGNGFSFPGSNLPSTNTSYGGTTVASFGGSLMEDPPDSFEAEMTATSEGNNFTMRPNTYAEPERRGHASSTSQLPADLVSSPAGSSFDDVARDIQPHSSQYPRTFEHPQRSAPSDTSDWQQASRPPVWMSNGQMNGTFASNSVLVSDGLDLPLGGTGQPLPYITQCKVGKPPSWGPPEAHDDRASNESLEKGLKFHLTQTVEMLDFFQQQMDTAFDEEMAHIDKMFPPDEDSEDDEDGEEDDVDDGYEAGHEFEGTGEEGESEQGDYGENGIATAGEESSSHSA